MVEKYDFKNPHLIHRLTLDQVIKEIENQEIEYVTIYYTAVAQIFCKRVYRYHFLNSVKDEGVKMPLILLNITVANDIVTTKNYDIGNATCDSIVRVDLESGFRRMSWLGKHHVCCFGIPETIKGSILKVNSRNFLKATLEKAKQELDLTFMHAPELEYYLVNEKTNEIVNKFPNINLKDYSGTVRNSDYCLATVIDRQEALNEKIKKNVNDCGIYLELLFNEHGPGQQEINIRYEDSLTSSDNQILVKQCIKHTAYENGFGATFMPKPYADQDGSSCHIHISVYKDGKSIFAPSNDKSQNDKIDIGDGKFIDCNKNLLYFLGGLCKYIPEMFLIFANNVNSYKRYKLNSFAPIYSNAWCYDSRSTGIRVVGEGNSLRLEVRFAGSDANAYLLPSCIIGAGCEGIKNKIDPPPQSTGNTYEFNENDEKKFQLKNAPTTLLESIKIFEKSDFCKQLLGEELYETIISIAKFEWQEFNDHISAYEIKRNLDSC